MSDAPLEIEFIPPKSLTKAQRRVLGVLIEKAFTTPESYPLTLKAVAAGCNQKSNRAPLTQYSEETCADTLEELRKLGLVGVVQTETGRTERFRHYVRRRYSITEPQLAIWGELLLRGRQAIGELRSRASRMTSLDSLEQLRTELDGMLSLGLLQADGSLDRRGVEIDHNLYGSAEGQQLAYREVAAEPASLPPRATVTHANAPVPVPASPGVRASPDPIVPHRNAEIGIEHTADEIGPDVRRFIDEIRGRTAALEDDLRSLRSTVSRLEEAVHELRRSLGG